MLPAAPDEDTRHRDSTAYLYASLHSLMAATQVVINQHMLLYESQGHYGKHTKIRPNLCGPVVRC